MHRQGITLIEALFVLGILMILTGMAMLLVSQSKERLNTNQLLQEITSIVQITHYVYSGINTYQGLSNNVIIGSGSLANRYVDPSGTKIINAFNGSLTVANANFDANSTPVFSLIITGLPKSTCLSLTTQNIGDQPSAMEINGNSIGDLGTSHPYLTASEAVKDCVDTQTNQVSFTFH